MKRTLALFAVVLTLGLSTAAIDAEAKRLGGGKSLGMKRQAAPAPTSPAAGNTATQGTTAPAASPAAAAAAPAAGAAAASKRSWMGPVAGLAAGLGLVALASHFGFGEALANMMMIGLLVMAVMLVIGFVLRKRAGQGPAMAGAGAGGAVNAGGFGTLRTGQQPWQQQPAGAAPPARGSLIGSRLGSAMSGIGAQSAAGGIPAGFDAAAFAANAKTQFLALQAANDAGDLVRLRDVLTPEMFEAVRQDIAERGAAPQATEVFGLQAQVLGVVEEDGQYIASVRFTGSIRDQQGAVPEDLDEVWHLSKPRSGASGWVIAGIQQAD